MLAIIGIVVILSIAVIAFVSMVWPRHRIVRYDRGNHSWYVPQESLVLWMFFRDMRQMIGPYMCGETYRFYTYGGARDFLNSLHRDKPRMTVVTH